MWGLIPTLSELRVAGFLLYLIDTNIISGIRKRGKPNPEIVYFLNNSARIFIGIYKQ
jgi:hypothetical protein